MELANGNQLVLEQSSRLPLASINLAFLGGECLETPANSGITSLAMRSSLKGAGSKDSEQLAAALEAGGSSLNLFPGYDYGCYSFRCLSSQVPAMLELLGDIILNPSFPEQEVKKEAEMASREAKLAEDRSSYAFDLLSEAMYGDQPLGLPAHGLPEAILAQSRADVAEWHHRLVRRNSILAAYGDLDESLLSDWLAGLPEPDEDKTWREQAGLAPILQPPAVRQHKRQRAQTSQAIGWKGVTVSEPLFPALELLAVIASGLGGRFHTIVRGKLGLAYSVSATNHSALQYGRWTAYTSTAVHTEKLALEKIREQVGELAEKPVGEEELARAKNYYRGAKITMLQPAAARSGELLRNARLGLGPDGTERLLGRIAEMTPADIQGAGQYLAEQREIWGGVLRGTG